jgi:hypothetical protein
MVRTLVSRPELVRIFTERMQQLPEGKGCSLEDVLYLAKPHVDGCNWLPGAVRPPCGAAIRKVFSQARFEFNLEDV